MPQVDERVKSMEVKIVAINEEIKAYSAKMSRMRDGPGKTLLKQKALKLLQKRKIMEAQKAQLEQQQDSMTRVEDMTENMKNNMMTVDVMKQTSKSLKQQYGKFDIDKIERMQDEMADLMEMGNDIQESISRSYDVPEDVDEAELDAELEALGDEMEMEYGQGESTPSFMVDEVPQFIDEAPNTGNKVQEPAR